MNFRRNKFKILLSIVCLVATALPVIGIFLTIAEGPNPFDFLLPLSLPAVYLLEIFNRFIPVPNLDGWALVLLEASINLVLYFLVGSLMDYTVNRLWGQRKIKDE